jgi:cell fate regulator YaaT (PSP1 superfamily)
MADIVQVALRGSRKEFFLNSRTLTLKLRDEIIVQSEHGESMGTVFLKDPTLVSLKRPGNVNREIIRKATEEDLDQQDHSRALEDKAFDYCKRRIEDRELKMDLSEVEAAFSGHRLTFFFSAEHRVDFRELVKDLASKFRTRIELRQIGVRDEAKLLADYGDCGKPVCCNTHMIVMPPVSMRMAKLQKSTLDPTKISGRCGRLKCCLRFEQDVYEEFVDQLAQMAQPKSVIEPERKDAKPKGRAKRKSAGNAEDKVFALVGTLNG